MRMAGQAACLVAEVERRLRIHVPGPALLHRLLTRKHALRGQWRSAPQHLAQGKAATPYSTLNPRHEGKACGGPHQERALKLQHAVPVCERNALQLWVPFSPRVRAPALLRAEGMHTRQHHNGLLKVFVKCWLFLASLANFDVPAERRHKVHARVWRDHASLFICMYICKYVSLSLSLYIYIYIYMYI